MLKINEKITIPLSELDITQVRASGPGGQNVNKVASAVHLRFSIHNSSLPEHCRKKLLCSNDRRITSDGTIVIKARQYRTFEKNRQDALTRLAVMIAAVLAPRTPRKMTRPTAASRRKRLDAKQKQGRLKQLRKKVSSE